MRSLLTVFVISSVLYSQNLFAAYDELSTLRPGSVVILAETFPFLGGPKVFDAQVKVEKEFGNFYKGISCYYTGAGNFIDSMLVCAGMPRTMTLPHYKKKK